MTHVIFRYIHWGHASPWLSNINPRDENLPTDGDDGFFPTTGNELVREFAFMLFLYDVYIIF